MFTSQLNKMDLNQLLVLNLILEHRSITQAARVLGVSQPAVSRTFSSLRTRFNDELLVRNKQSYILTPLAINIQPKLERLIACLEDLTNDEEFDPSTYEGQFNVALLSAIGPKAATRIIKRIRNEAPHVCLKLFEWEKESLDDLQALNLDLGVGHANMTYSMLRQRQLGLLYPSFAVLNEHPLAQQKKVTLEELFSHLHIKVIIPGFERSIETEINCTDFPRHVVLETASIGIAVNTFIEAGDLVINKAKYLPALLEHKEKLTFLTISDIERPPGMELQVLWHSRNQSVPAHRWLRELIFDEVNGMLGD